MKQVVFLCSANYYRSRFAEHFFNWLADQEEGLGWRADSRGLAVDPSASIGRISLHTVEALAARGIHVDGQHRYPKKLTATDLVNADLVVAVKEAEHRAMMAGQFPQWVDRIEYWHIDDLDCALPEESMPVLEKSIRALVARLRAGAADESSRAA
jgi:protein-tyrosine phosphatase